VYVIFVSIGPLTLNYILPWHSSQLVGQYWYSQQTLSVNYQQKSTCTGSRGHCWTNLS